MSVLYMYIYDMPRYKKDSKLSTHPNRFYNSDDTFDIRIPNGKILLDTLDDIHLRLIASLSDISRIGRVEVHYMCDNLSST